MVTITVPAEIQSKDMGIVDVSYSHSASVGTYKCPLCWHLIDKGESHYILVPKTNRQLRKHVHTDCLKAYLEHKLDIKLFPEQFKFVRVGGHGTRKR